MNNFRELDALPVQELTVVPVDTLRELYRTYRKLAEFSMDEKEFDASVKAQKPVDAVGFIAAARKVKVTCGKCNGTGVYSWGAVVNGVVSHTGACFQCGGKGKQNLSDMRRNRYYWNHVKVF